MPGCRSCLACNRRCALRRAVRDSGRVDSLAGTEGGFGLKLVDVVDAVLDVIGGRPDPFLLGPGAVEFGSRLSLTPMAVPMNWSAGVRHRRHARLAALTRHFHDHGDQQHFNGVCGAKAAASPVSAVAPAMLSSPKWKCKSAPPHERPPICLRAGFESTTTTAAGHPTKTEVKQRENARPIFTFAVAALLIPAHFTSTRQQQRQAPERRRHCPSRPSASRPRV